MQIQGLSPHAIPVPVATSTDSPFAVDGNHRYDYGSSSRICMFLSAGSCLDLFAVDYSHCKLRCWGSESPTLIHQKVWKTQELGECGFSFFSFLFSTITITLFGYASSVVFFTPPPQNSFKLFKCFILQY